MSQTDTPQENTVPMAYDRMAIEDPLLECLVLLARDHGRRTSVAALTAGLPLSKEGFASPGLFVRAAERANMSARLVRRSLENIAASPGLPCILVLKNQQACILKSVTDGIAETVFPETPDMPMSMELEALEEKYGGYAFFVTGQARMDTRSSPTTSEDEGKDWFWGVIRRHKDVYKQVVVAAFMINAFGIVIPIFIMNVYDRVLPNKAYDSLWVMSVGVALALAFDFIIKNLRTHFLDAAGRKADIRISSRIFEHIQSINLSSRPPSSGVLADNMREFETLRDFFTSATVATLIDLPFVFLFLLIIGLVGGPIVFVPVAFTVAILAFGAVLQKPLAKVIEENARESAFKSNVLIETLNGLETIKIQAAEGHNQRKWEEIVEKSSMTSVKSRAISALGMNFTGLAAGLTTVGVIIYGVYLVSEGFMMPGALFACITLSSRVIAPLSQMAAILTRLNQARTALQRLNSLMELPSERGGERSFVSKPVFEGNITLRDVTFRYPGQSSNIISKVSFDVKEGERVGIIGSVGSGKTTLQRLITNLYQPDNGAIEVDGLDVRQIEPGDLRRNIGVAQQDAYMFYGSVRDNITMGHEAVADDAVLRAAELSGVMDFMRHSPMGLDTPVGERGAYLSGGQRQSIAIARALLYDPPILILDEPTAHIDPKSEKILYQKLAKICAGKTVILITHRSTLLGLIEKIALMDKGQLVAFGERNEVLANLQARKYGPADTAGGED